MNEIIAPFEARCQGKASRERLTTVCVSRLPVANVAEEGIALRDIAAVIGRRLGVPVASIAVEDAERHFGHLSMFVGLDNPTSSEITRDALGWTPTRPGLISDLDEEHNLVAGANIMSAG